jgi:AcrR family transcriptional regulator
MAKPQQRGLVKRAQILETAGALFARNGYEATTLAMVAKASGAVVGSVAYQFDDKPGLATAVYEDVVARLAAVIGQSLRGRGHKPSGGVQGLLRAYFEWATANPHHQRILDVLTDYAAEHGQAQGRGLQARVEPLLLDWSLPLVNAGKMRPLTATQLFAIIMAPAMASTAVRVTQCADQAERSKSWERDLAAFAIAAIKPLAQTRMGKADGNDGATSQAIAPSAPPDLFGKGETGSG